MLFRRLFDIRLKRGQAFRDRGVKTVPILQGGEFRVRASAKSSDLILYFSHSLLVWRVWDFSASVIAGSATLKKCFYILS